MIHEPEGWTPKLVGERLVAALRWAERASGRVGPAAIRSTMPTYLPTLEDHLAEGWGLPEVAGDDGALERPMERHPTPAEIDAHMQALSWVAEYLAKDHRNLAMLLQLWLLCRLGRADWKKTLQNWRVSRAHAYRLRDRALGMIAQGLERKGIKP